MRTFDFDTNEFISQDSSATRRKRWRLWLVAFDVIAITAMLVLSHVPLLKATHVSYSGPSQWESEARSLVRFPIDSNLVQFQVDSLELLLNEHFGVRAEAHVKLRLPDAIAIKLEPTDIALWIDASLAVSPSGTLVNNPAPQSADAMVWTVAQQSKRSKPMTDPGIAVGSWHSVLEADPRFARIGSEWNYDAHCGWNLVAADGQTRVILGRGLLAERAQAVSRLLAQTVHALNFPCIIDARVPGQLIVTDSDGDRQIRPASVTIQH